MKTTNGRKSRRIAVLLGLSTLVGAGAAIALQSTAPGSAGAPDFLRANQCYRLTFPITGAPNWKVLEVPGNGWVRAEIDAGPASSAREPVWINLAQVITVRDARCSQ